ncbi:40S ribosomal protein S11-B [Cucumispora dikerogammari]|nr:40S ribosomal protein S11-B [Cucumispora dikerogammari]
MDDSSKLKTFPQQHGIYNNPYKKTEKPKRFYRTIDGFITPLTAINGTYIDKKCPFTGTVRLTGKLTKASVVSIKQPTTISVMKTRLHYVSKYKRYERRIKKLSVHLSPCFKGLVEVGDIVTIAETRPLSKTVHNVIVAVEKKGDKLKQIQSL